MTSTLGQRLEFARQEADIAPAQLARDVGTTDATISNWLADKVNPKDVKGLLACLLAARLKIRVEWLLLAQEPMRQGSPVAAGTPQSVSGISDTALHRIALGAFARGLARSIPPAAEAVAAALEAELRQLPPQPQIEGLLALLRSHPVPDTAHAPAPAPGAQTRP